MKHVPRGKVISLLDDNEDGIEIGRRAAQSYRQSAASVIFIDDSHVPPRPRQHNSSANHKQQAKSRTIKVESSHQNPISQPTRGVNAKSVVKREPSTTIIKQEFIDVDTVDTSKIKVFPASTIKRDFDDEQRRKRIKLEEDSGADLSMFAVSPITPVHGADVTRTAATDTNLSSAEMEEDEYAKEHEAQIAEIDRQMAEMRAKQKADFENLMSRY